SVTEQLRMSSFSNYGAINELGTAHQSLFFAPGGESEPPGHEIVASSQRVTTRFWGTSYAAAYASAVVAHAYRRFDNDRGRTISELAKAARKDIYGYEESRHGPGLILPPP